MIGRPRGEITEKVLALLVDNEPAKFDVEAIREKLGIDKKTKQPIYNALHELTKSGEINKEKKKQGMGSWYFTGDADPLEGYEPKSKGTKPQPTDTTLLSQYLSPGLHKGKKMNGAASAPVVTNTSKVAAGVGAASSAGAGNETAPAGDTLDKAEPVLYFAIRDDGELGISSKDCAVSLPPAEVLRLRAFLDATASIWERR